MGGLFFVCHQQGYFEGRRIWSLLADWRKDSNVWDIIFDSWIDFPHYISNLKGHTGEMRFYIYIRISYKNNIWKIWWCPTSTQKIELDAVNYRRRIAADDKLTPGNGLTFCKPFFIFFPALNGKENWFHFVIVSNQNHDLSKWMGNHSVSTQFWYIYIYIYIYNHSSIFQWK